QGTVRASSSGSPCIRPRRARASCWYPTIPAGCGRSPARSRPPATFVRPARQQPASAASGRTSCCSTPARSRARSSRRCAPRRRAPRFRCWSYRARWRPPGSPARSRTSPSDPRYCSGMLLALLLAASLPDFTGYVVDRAHLLDPNAVAHVTAVASRLDHAGVAQLAVCTVPESALGDDPLEDYAVAPVLEADAAAGGEAAPAREGQRGGTGVGMRGYAGPVSYGGLGITILCMGAFAIVLASSGARRRFPGKGTQLAGAGLTGASVVSLISMSSGAGWLVLVVGVIVNAVIWASLRADQCPRDGSWMVIEDDLVSPP